MKVAISSKGQNLDSEVDLRFGRAKWFIIADTERDDFEAHPNEQNLNAPHGAGIQSAANVARHGVQCVITGHCGPNAFRTLKSQSIRVMLISGGTVAEALEKLKKGELETVSAPDVEGHWA